MDTNFLKRATIKQSSEARAGDHQVWEQCDLEVGGTESRWKGEQSLGPAPGQACMWRLVPEAQGTGMAFTRGQENEDANCLCSSENSTQKAGQLFSIMTEILEFSILETRLFLCFSCFLRLVSFCFPLMFRKVPLKIPA